MTKIIFISDTHNLHAQVPVPDGEILIHAGDFTKHGTREEVEEFARWFSGLPHKHKIVIAGNHDFMCEAEPELTRIIFKDVLYLLDEEVVCDGIRIYGSPWQPWFHDWAFNLQRGSEIAQKWALIPSGTDILVTHGPPHGIRDEVIGGELVGCQDLLMRVQEVKPRFHLFGHIHEGYGVTELEGILYANGSTCDVRYRAVNKAMELLWV